jgi:hypothetical protein
MERRKFTREFKLWPGARPGLLGKLALSTAELKRSDACRFSFVTTMLTRPSRC